MPQGQPFQAGFTPPPNAQGVPFQGGGFAPPGLSQGGDPLFAGPPIQPNVPPATGQGIPFQSPGGFMPPGLGMRAGMGQPNQTALMMGLLQMLARRGGGGLGGGGFGQGSGMGGGQFGGF
jgi:hypothetical protein